MRSRFYSATWTPPVRRTKAQAAATRQTILDAAQALFVAHGYEHVSLDQIAEAAGTTRGAVHFHFVNKAGVLLATCEEDRLRLQALVEHLEREPSAVPLDGLLEILVEMLSAYQEDEDRRALIRAALSMGLKLADDERDDFLEFEERFVAVMVSVLDAAAARGQLAAPWTARSAAVALFALITGLLMGWALGSRDVQLAPGGVEAIRGIMSSFRA